MLIGYVRVSTNDQQTDLQRESLNRANCELIFEDKISGTKSERPGLKKLLKRVKTGDTVVVWKLDRLGRSVRHLITLVADLKTRGGHFKSITDNIDTSSAAGRFFFHVMSALAEMERELIVERTLAGLAVARTQGRIGECPRRLSSVQIEQSQRLLDKGHSRKELALIYNVSLATIYKYLPASNARQ
ncbi:recombinase family protein [Limnobaculum xujianqingii]|uniref:recombinase family protein n=1 Tax=Limnobaculum xujianqingii TaxID=2738837 RepID=UPI00112C3D00|nr:recombinase family protein [Limnobaculum xujianqingii]